MELTLQTVSRNNTSSVQAQTTVRSSQSQPETNTSSAADRLTLSQQALEYLDELDQQAQAEAEQRDAAEDGSSGISDILDTLCKAMKEMQKCNKIAASIMKGKQVPKEYLEYLMEHDIKGYQLAMAARRPSKDDEKEKSVLDDEDRRNEAAGTAVSSDASLSCGVSAECTEAPAFAGASVAAETGS
jgi:hypothetical protein